MNKFLLLLLALTLSTITVNAQDFEFGQNTNEELNMKKYMKDTSAHAVVLNEYGYSMINATNDDKIRLIYKYHVKIKLFDKEGFDKANVEIPFYSSDGFVYEEINDIKAVTTSVDDNGQTQNTELDNSKIYEVKDNKYWSRKKFALPAVRKGCIIEYEYTIISPYFENFRSWDFQDDIPKINSEYDIHIPAFFVYNAAIKGALKLTKNVAEREYECFSARGSKADCSHFIYGITDIPAFIDDEYMTSAKNFKSGLTFELSEYTNPYDGAHTVLTKDWKSADYEMKHDEDFGGQLKKKDLFKDRLTPVLAGKTDDLEKAKAVYAYMQKTIKWNNIYSRGAVDGIRKTLNNHTGSIGDINLALTTALSAAGLNAEAVMLSTREHGVVNKLYPVLTEFNYVIAKVDIGDKSYLLDATDPLLGFGMLPLRCLNDQGRVMSLDKPSFWIDLNTFEKEKSTYLLDLTLQTDGKLKGTLTHYSAGYEGYNKRVAIKKFNTTDEYVENMDEKLPKMKILKSEFTNLDSLDLPLGEKYDIEINASDEFNHDRLIFNPIMFNKYTVNPFKLAQRDYPVDVAIPFSERFSVTMHLPEQYTIEGPQNISFSLPNDGGSFITDFEKADNTFTYSNVIQLNKPLYSPQEYPYLKEFFNKIILSEKEEMVFNKKK